MESSGSDLFRVQWTKFNGYRVPYLLQNSDGQCPLICLSNIILLRRKLQLPKDCKKLGFDNLCSYICSALQDINTEWVTSVLISLKKGLIFNCKFDSTRAFIEPDAKQLFEMFGIAIKHGWIADPIEYGQLSNLNYDELLDKLAIYQCRDEERRLKECAEENLYDQEEDNNKDQNLEVNFENLKLNSGQDDENRSEVQKLNAENDNNDVNKGSEKEPNEKERNTRDVGTNTTGTEKYRMKPVTRVERVDNIERPTDGKNESSTDKVDDDSDNDNSNNRNDSSNSSSNNGNSSNRNDSSNSSSKNDENDNTNNNNNSNNYNNNTSNNNDSDNNDGSNNNKENNRSNSEEKSTNCSSKEVEEDEFDEEIATLAIDFLDRYATQLTEYGIRVLKHEIPEESLVALYRNNHFLVATMYRKNIFTLVTDSAFYGHECVWESLETGEYFDENFKKYVQMEIKPKKQTLLEKCKNAFKRSPRR